MIGAISWKEIALGLWSTFLADLNNIKWVLPIAFLFAYAILMLFYGIDAVMEIRERESGRYRGLHAISYVEDSDHENAVGEVQGQGYRTASIVLPEMVGGKPGRGQSQE